MNSRSTPNPPSGDNDISRHRYEYIAQQINREDSLINFRLTWTLQLNGFLFAALALVGKDVDGPIRSFFAFALPVTGSLVSIAGVLGVIAAHRQLRYLTDMWRKEKSSSWPRPFGDSRAFSLGRLPSFVPPVVLSLVWFVLLLQNITAPMAAAPPPAPELKTSNLKGRSEG